MELTRNKLRGLIVEELTRVLSEQSVSGGADPQQGYEELKTLRANRDLDLASQLGGAAQYSALLQVRDGIDSSAPKAFEQFRDLVVMPSPSQRRYEYDPTTGKMTTVQPEGNDFMLNSLQASHVFRGMLGVTPPDQIDVLTKRREELESLYERQDVTDERDAMYGRKRHQIVHIPTGTVVDGGVNRQGSLGS